MLKTLRTKSRKLMLATLILVIPAFILFYGWNDIGRNSGGSGEIEIGKFQPADSSKWQEITQTDLRYPNWELEQQMYSYVYQQKWSNYLRRNGQQSVIQEMMEGRDPRQNIWREVYSMRDEELVTQRDSAVHFLDIETLDQYASEKDVRVAESELVQAMRNLLSGYTPENYYIPLSQAGLTQNTAEPYMAEKIQLDRTRQMVSRKAMVSRFELWKQYLLGEEEIKLSYVSFNSKDFEVKVEVTEDALKEYYTENGEDFRVGDQRRYRYAYQLRDSLADDVEVTDAEIEAYYEENQSRFMTDKAVKVRHIFFEVDPAEIEAGTADTTATLKLIDEIKAQLDEGVDFAELANKYSQDPANVKGEGDDAEKLGGAIDGWLSMSNAMFSPYGQDFVLKALGMEKGAVSDVVYVSSRDRMGFSIMKVEDIREPEAKPLAEVGDGIRAILKQDKMQKAFSERIEALRDELRKTQFSSVDLAAKELGLKTGETDLILKSKSTIPVTSGTLRIQSGDLDYINETLSLDTEATFGSANQVPSMSSLLVSRSQMVGDTAAFILQLVETKASHIPELSEVREEVEAAFKRDKGREMMLAAAEDFRAAADSAESWEKAAEVAGLEMKSSGFFKRYPRAFVFEQGVPLDSVGVSTDYEVGDTGVMALGYNPDAPSAYAAWHLDEVKSPDKEAFENEQVMLRANVMNMKRASFLEEWLLDQRRKMKIAIQ